MDEFPEEGYIYFMNTDMLKLGNYRDYLFDNTSWRKLDMEEGSKEDKGKVRVDLVPVESIIGVAQILTNSVLSGKYEANNWKKGISWMKLYASTLRHLFFWVLGFSKDKDSGLPHLSHAATNIMMLMYYSMYELYDKYDNRYTINKTNMEAQLYGKEAIGNI